MPVSLPKSDHLRTDCSTADLALPLTVLTRFISFAPSEYMGVALGGVKE